MYASSFFIPTMREAPKDAVIPSHILMIRAGLIRKLYSGVYGLLPLGLRSVRKIENIIREEMDAIGGNEFLIPVIIPGDLWKQSGRWQSMGPELFRLRDRSDADFVLAPTHEEAFTAVLKDSIRSYRDLPLTVYHIGPKFRDEIRPRFGVMRGKTFIMKDAYSFHRAGDDPSLDRVYDDMARAYRRVFQRCGLQTVPVSADSGAMGGSVSEEFMVPAEVGEEEMVLCPSCGYAANREKAEAGSSRTVEYQDQGSLTEVATPGAKTIEALANFLNVGPEYLIKTLVFKTSDGRYVLALTRGDLDLNETKLKNHLGAVQLEKADIAETKRDLGIPLGYAGPVGVTNALIVADNSVKPIRGGVTGANREGFHFTGVNPGRDFTPEQYLDLGLVNEKDPCARCGTALNMVRGIELGHIFKLGDKYTKAFEVSYLEEDGSQAVPAMGCYGIGVDRTAAAIIEQNHDERGIVWPMQVAPFHVYLLPIKFEGRVKEFTVDLKQKLEAQGVEVLVDDRSVRPGVKFNDADLIGIPLRVTVGDKGLDQGSVEVYTRKTGEKKSVPQNDVVEHIVNLVREGRKG